MRDKFSPLEPEHPGPDPGCNAELRRPGDVDQMVFSFLSELDTLSDTLELVHDQSAERSAGLSIAPDRSDPQGAQPAVIKPVSYRNIDVLLMDNRQFASGKERSREDSPHTIHGLFESQPAAHSAGKRRRRIRKLIGSAASMTLLSALGVLYYFEAGQLVRKVDVAAQLQATSFPSASVSPSSLPKAGAPASPPKAASPAVAIERVIPRYPAEARRLGVSGTVELDAEVDANGKVVRALPVSGPLLLRPAAAEALLKWRFKPAQQGGINLKSKARVSVVFN